MLSVLSRIEPSVHARVANHVAPGTRSLHATTFVAMFTATLVMLLATAAGASVLYATPYGPGTGWDQSMYIGSARNLLAGAGLSIPWGTDAGRPLTHFPPVFPLALAALGLVGVDPLEGAHYLNAVLRSTNLALVGLLATRLSPGSIAGPLATVFLLFSSVHMANLHEEAWSEPLFLPACFAALYLLAQYLRRPTSSRMLLSAACVAAVAILTRYVGLAIALAGGALIVFATSAPTPRKLRDMALYGVVSTGPLVGWAARNKVLGVPAVGYRAYGWHPVEFNQLGQLAYTLLDWFVPNQLVVQLVRSDGSVTIIGAAVLPICAALALACGARVSHAEHPFVRWVLPVFIGAYLLSVLVALSLFDNLIQIDSRTLSPIYVAVVVLVGAGVAQVSKMRPGARIALAGVASVLSVVYLARFITGTQAVHIDGISYASKKYLASSIVEQINHLPDEAIVYSNAPDGVYILTHRESFAIPDATSMVANFSLIAAQLQQEHRPVYVAYFTDPDLAYRQLVPTIFDGSFAVTRVVEDASGSLAQLTQLAGGEQHDGT